MLKQLSELNSAKGIAESNVEVATIYLAYNNREVLKKLIKRGKYYFDNKEKKVE